MDEVRQVRSRADWRIFIDLPWQLYRGDPHWVPPLRLAVRDALDERKNLFFSHAEQYPLLAFRHGKPVGRVVGIIDHYYNEFHGDLCGQFGFFECIDDNEIAALLLDEVARWARASGMKRLQGPFSPSSNYESGLLIDGFDDDPYVMMAYNPPYYANLLEAWGLRKIRDLNAYELGRDFELPDRIRWLAERQRQRASITFRNIYFDRRFRQDIQDIFDIYHAAWKGNWGFAPLHFDEFYAIAKDMKRITTPEFVIMAQVDSTFAGFAMAVPDANQAIKTLGNGKLLPFGILRLLWHLKGPLTLRAVNRVRLVTLGIKPEFESLGLGPILYTEYRQRLITANYQACELSWVLEDNPVSRNLAMVGAKKTKVYRIYQAVLP
jgi:Acetyltransferase (GNAT) family